MSFYGNLTLNIKMHLTIISNSKLFFFYQTLYKYKRLLPRLDLDIFGAFENKDIQKYINKYKFTKIKEKPTKEDYKFISSLISLVQRQSLCLVQDY